MTKKEILVLAIGFTGQFLFFMRFFIQWIYSERRKKSMIPTAFWYLSIAGSLVLLIYAILRRDIVFIAGQAFGILIYLRNLYFISKEKTHHT
ncbi:MAG: lipid-A-disaccharide synthase N-terminal domain-containing protein [Dissulfurimicrobium sp.]|uniref:lipid-A-disaccharide synthase N-terminal domain-containing protein n=1 Tax=Dissulfurimicrobium hydrothermale TaxID=1750598 RepID=UPI001EDA64BE|nr:lipid-A-disaccharide synthase N-terminal domain-containing protein [Dissulfurimicrobium hydrothermale]UKL13059.1 lipid-A-disaccharide synthase N-terminal domain-containing protein [Dissulfurimicrobium hydrothermale]